jgi:hypothetical protein
MGIRHRLGQACIWAGLGFVLAGLFIQADEFCGMGHDRHLDAARLDVWLGSASAKTGDDSFLQAVLRLPLWVPLAAIRAAMGLLGLALQDGNPPSG